MSTAGYRLARISTCRGLAPPGTRQHPRNQKFYHTLTMLMSFACLGDRRLMGYKKPPRLAFINSTIMRYFGPVCVLSQIIYLYVNYSELNFDILGIIFSIFPATCLANVNIASSRLKSYKRLIGTLFSEIHLHTVYEENKDEFVKSRVLKTERYTRWTTCYLVFFFVINWLGWICITAVNNYNNRELVLNHTTKLQTCVFLWLPLDYSYNFQYCVFKEVEYAFGFNVIANYTQNLVGNSIVLYQLMYGGRENMMLYITMIMAYTGGPILMSFVLEEVKKQTDDLPEVVYSMPWENMSVSNQKTVLLILQRVQIVFEFEALGILIAGVKPMFSILKTTFSYYVMLETTMSIESQ